MSRTLAAIQLALQLVAPHFQPRAQAAVELRYLGEEFSIDPFTMIAVGERESGWDSRVVGKLGEVGIGQVMPSNFPSCRDDPNGDVCTGLRQYLHEWQFNLGMAMGLMSIQRTSVSVQPAELLARQSWALRKPLSPLAGSAGMPLTVTIPIR